MSKKRIVICSDGTWNRPEEDLAKDFPTNVLLLARAIKPIAKDNIPQQVFYDCGVGSYYDKLIGGVTGRGLHKNIMDDYRYIVQNYSPGDELFFFGFSRGAYTVRSLCGLINNCGIIKRPDAQLIRMAFDHYKKPSGPYSPKGGRSVEFREEYTYSKNSPSISFVGVWDTVGAMGIPKSFLGLFEDEDEFYDTKMGNNIRVTRHAMAIDEKREDFEPTIWEPRKNVDLKQVWFIGAHSDVGGGIKPDKDGSVLSDVPLRWMINEANAYGLTIEDHLEKKLKNNPMAKLHPSRRNFYRIKGKHIRDIDHKKGGVLIHKSVKRRWDGDKKYRPANLRKYVDSNNGWPSNLVR